MSEDKDGADDTNDAVDDGTALPSNDDGSSDTSMVGR